MKRPLIVLLLAGAALSATPAAAQKLRDYCPERPGLTTPACTTDAGHLSIETGLADWTRDRDPDQVTDTFLLGDTLLRYGLTDRVEAQLGWTPLGIVRTRDRESGAVSHRSRTGDVTLGLKANFARPDPATDSGFSLALLPSVSLPVGREPVGAGDWGASLRVPASYRFSEKLTILTTSEIDAQVDEDGNGRHLQYGTAAGVRLGLSKKVDLSVDGQVLRDRDPSGHRTMALASASIDWKAADDLQFDAGAVAGLNHASPGIELYVGISRRF